MNNIRKIGLKYCGGCTPQYDRVQAVVSIKRRLAGRIEFVSYEDRDVEGVLVVVGCPTACVDIKPFEGFPVWVITSERDIGSFVEKILQME